MELTLEAKPQKIRMTRTEVYEYTPDFDDDAYVQGTEAYEHEGEMHTAIEPGDVDTLEKAIEVDKYYLHEVGLMEEEIGGAAKSVTITFEVIDA